jgi:hypothetical protein
VGLGLLFGALVGVEGWMVLLQATLLALVPGGTARKAAAKGLVISSGLHEVEGYFGSAVKLAILQRGAC